MFRNQSATEKLVVNIWYVFVCYLEILSITNIREYQSIQTTNLRAQPKSQSAERTYDLVIMEMCPEPEQHILQRIF